MDERKRDKPPARLASAVTRDKNPRSDVRTKLLKGGPEKDVENVAELWIVIQKAQYDT